MLPVIAAVLLVGLVGAGTYSEAKPKPRAPEVYEAREPVPARPPVREAVAVQPLEPAQGEPQARPVPAPVSGPRAAHTINGIPSNGIKRVQLEYYPESGALLEDEADEQAGSQGDEPGTR